MIDAGGFPDRAWVSVPSNSRARGIPGQRAVDTVNKYIYDCITPDYWVRHLYTDFAGQTRDFSYVSDGDANGIFYFMGTQLGISVWANPATAIAGLPGRLLVSANGGTANSTVGWLSGTNYSAATSDRTANLFHTDNSLGASSNVMWDFGSCAVLLKGINWQQRNDSGSTQSSQLTFEGSNDNVSWTTIIANAPVAAGTAGVWTYISVTAAQSTFYRYIRVKGNNGNYMTGSEVEFYGSLSY